MLNNNAEQLINCTIGPTYEITNCRKFVQSEQCRLFPVNVESEMSFTDILLTYCTILCIMVWFFYHLYLKNTRYLLGYLLVNSVFASL